MRIDIIDTEAGFDAIRPQWERIFMIDEYAQHFLSWSWLRQYMFRRRRWFVLALREKPEGSPYVAFFPLRMVTQIDRKTGRFIDEIIMAGNFAADYTGFITLPEYEHHAINGFCAWLKRQNWTHIKLDYFWGPPHRREKMIEALMRPGVMYRDSTPKSPNNIDNTLCPVVPLPATFDAYLESRMSAQTRQKLRRFLRKVESDPEWRITFATDQTIRRDLEILFDLWRIKWTPSKGAERTEKLINGTREVLMDCYNDGTLEVPVLWYGERPLGALANIIDRQKKAVLFYITGRDEEWKTPSPGLVLHGYCIRRAIEAGFSHYDFLRGNESYKYMFGPDERRLSCTLFRSRSGDNLGGTLNPRSIRFVYEKALRHYHAGEKQFAETGFRQVLEAAPDHDGARFGLANLMFEKGDFIGAEQSYAVLVTRAPDPVPALLRLGETQLALKRYHEAVWTFRSVLGRKPLHREALYKCGVALVAAGNRLEAMEVFTTLQSWHSDDPIHMAYAEKARLAFGRLASTLVREGAGQVRPVIAPYGDPMKIKRWTQPKILH